MEFTSKKPKSPFESDQQPAGTKYWVSEFMQGVHFVATCAKSKIQNKEDNSLVTIARLTYHAKLLT